MKYLTMSSTTNYYMSLYEYAIGIIGLDLLYAILEFNDCLCFAKV